MRESVGVNEAISLSVPGTTSLTQEMVKSMKKMCMHNVCNYY